MSTKTPGCPRCGMNARLQKRTFSDQALKALIAWGDLDAKLKEEGVCDSCYGELRDVLIERSEDLKQFPESPRPMGRAS